MNAVWVKLQPILVAVWEEDMLEKKLDLPFPSVKDLVNEEGRFELMLFSPLS
jgi:hypothetical protein